MFVALPTPDSSVAQKQYVVALQLCAYAAPVMGSVGIPPGK